VYYDKFEFNREEERYFNGVERKEGENREEIF